MVREEVRIRARELERTGNAQGARDLYLSLAKEENDSPETWSRLAELQLASRDVPAATRSLARAAALFATGGRRNVALALTRKLVELSPQDPDAHRTLAELAIEQGYGGFALASALQLLEAAGTSDASDAARLAGAFSERFPQKVELWSGWADHLAAREGPGAAAVYLRSVAARLGGAGYGRASTLLLAECERLDPSGSFATSRAATDPASPLRGDPILPPSDPEDAGTVVSGIAPLPGLEPTHAVDGWKTEAVIGDSSALEIAPLAPEVPGWASIEVVGERTGTEVPQPLAGLDPRPEPAAGEIDPLPLLGFSAPSEAPEPLPEPALPLLETSSESGTTARSGMDDLPLLGLEQATGHEEGDEVVASAAEPAERLRDEGSPRDLFDLPLLGGAPPTPAPARGLSGTGSTGADRPSQPPPSAEAPEVWESFRSGGSGKSPANAAEAGGRLGGGPDSGERPGSSALGGWETTPSVEGPSPAKGEGSFPWEEEVRAPGAADTAGDLDFGRILHEIQSITRREVDAADPSTHYDLGLAFKEMGLIDEAIAQLAAAIRAGYRPLAGLEVLGEILVERGDHYLAWRILGAAAGSGDRAEDELAGVVYWLARSEEELGRPTDACAHFRRVVAAVPAFRDAAERLRSCLQAPL